jgi:dimethylhistidine N-methyltransferase
MDSQTVEILARQRFAHDSSFAADVRFALMLEPRQLPSRYLYDELGSALFAAICRLPWYQITRAEIALLRSHAREILYDAGRLARIVELGPGPGDKLAALLEAGYDPRDPLEVHCVDVSAAALAQSKRAVASLGAVQVVGHEAPYEEGLAALAGDRVGMTLVLLLGSTIGNFDRPSAEEFLRDIRASMAGGDLLLVGADLVKPERDLLLAYDDPIGVSAAFNRNLLFRINRELGGNFELDGYRHRAVWNAPFGRVEMHLVSRASQRIVVPSADVDIALADEEPIWTAGSYKFQPDDIANRLHRAGFDVARQWVDRERGFALTLARAAALASSPRTTITAEGAEFAEP